MDWTRREFMTTVAAGLAVTRSEGLGAAQAQRPSPLFKISLAQWSLHRELGAKKLDHLDFAKTARRDFGIEGIEYVTRFFKDKARDAA